MLWEVSRCAKRRQGVVRCGKVLKDFFVARLELDFRLLSLETMIKVKILQKKSCAVSRTKFFRQHTATFTFDTHHLLQANTVRAASFQV